ATFSVPDERGWKPSGECIRQEFPLGEALITDLPVKVLVNKLSQSGFEVEESNDPGRFELILQVLGTFPSQREARQYLKRIGMDENPALKNQPGGPAHYRDSITRNNYGTRLNYTPHPAEVISVNLEQNQRFAFVHFETSLTDFNSTGMLQKFVSNMVHLDRLSLTPVVFLDSQGEFDVLELQKAGDTFVNEVEKVGARSMAFNSPIFSKTSSDLLLESNSILVDLEPIRIALRLKHIP
ncbi:hypothetical protein HK096_011534, partial [Nowakowskiella sp. JEL0078]